MKNLAIIQARMSSSRLPGKVLMELWNGKKALEIMLIRLKNSKLIDKIIVATSIESSDNQIETECKKIGVEIFRGSLTNVLERFYLASIKYNPENVIRLTADCPLHDGKIVDDLIQFFEFKKLDYANNSEDERSYPDGTDAEIFSFKALKEAYENATLQEELEHVTPYIRKHAKNKGLLHYNEDFKHMRITLDNKEDLNIIRAIFRNFNRLDFTLEDIIKFYKSNPEVFEENKHLNIYLKK